ncbi:MAG: long-chain fatty acid--CoA ligase, partial [Fibrobacter sp.]|nr:long-chain fatty acid--CoA ligase [Fibrobacter sp.]
MLIQNFLENSAEKFPDKEAVQHNNTWFSYIEIEHRANKIANFLVENGISRGDRAALLINNSIDYITSYFGILKAGAVVVSINNEITATNLQFFLENSDAQALICAAKFSSIIKDCTIPEQIKFILTTEVINLPHNCAQFSLPEIQKT